MKPAVEINKRYYRRTRGMFASVRLVTGISGNEVFYRVLHGPALKKHPVGKTTLNGMKRWMTDEYTGDENYYRLDGAHIHESYLVQDTEGNVRFRCGMKRAKFYLRKGYAVEVGDHLIRLTNNKTIEIFNQLYDGKLSSFFLAVKNQKCVVCGVDRPLTRHHVVPRRITRILPKSVKCRLSNILFVCVDCHKRYNDNDITHEELDPNVWMEHFVKTMEPKHLPEGWTLVTIEEGKIDENGDPLPVSVYIDPTNPEPQTVN